MQTLVACLLLGLALGLSGPVDESIPEPFQRASATLGWSYFTAWTVSFYPQVFDNWKRQSVEGLSLDYLVFSMIGFCCYAAYTASLKFNPIVSTAYMTLHGGAQSDVQLPDVMFAGHAVAVTLLLLFQYAAYGTKDQGLSTTGKALTAAFFLGTAGVLFHITSTCETIDCEAWLSLLYYFGSVKVFMTLVKYAPQAVLNHNRRSTEGWHINNVLLDLAGGILSLAQILMDASARNDWSVVTGNPAKLGISGISIAFDVLFIAQHYLLYRRDLSVPVPVSEALEYQKVKVDNRYRS